MELPTIPAVYEQRRARLVGGNLQLGMRHSTRKTYTFPDDYVDKPPAEQFHGDS